MTTCYWDLEKIVGIKVSTSKCKKNHFHFQLICSIAVVNYFSNLLHRYTRFTKKPYIENQAFKTTYISFISFNFRNFQKLVGKKSQNFTTFKLFGLKEVIYNFYTMFKFRCLLGIYQLTHIFCNSETLIRSYEFEWSILLRQN